MLTRGGDPAADHAAIVAIARDAGATTIVVGPAAFAVGQDRAPRREAALAEIEALRSVADAAGITVVADDERLTTVTAERSLQEARWAATRGAASSTRWPPP